jgi:hypothetical protein
MRRLLPLALVVLLLALAVVLFGSDIMAVFNPTPTSAPTPTLLQTATFTPTFTPTPTVTLTATATLPHPTLTPTKTWVLLTATDRPEAPPPPTLVIHQRLSPTGNQPQSRPHGAARCVEAVRLVSCAVGCTCPELWSWVSLPC